MKQLLTTLLLLTATVSADLRPGAWELAGELLVWEPCGHDFVFAHTAAARPNGNDLYTVKPEYAAGVRVLMGAEDCAGCVSAALSYTWLSSSAADQVTGQTLRLEIPDFSLNLVRVEARDRRQYWDVDLELRRVLLACGGGKVGAVGGIRYINLESSRSATGRQAPPSNPVAVASQDRLSGFVFTGGVVGEQCMCGRLSLRGKILGLVGAGEQSNSWRVLSGAGAGLSAYGGLVPSNTTCLTGVHARLALGGELCWCRCRLGAEVAYEVLHYVDALRKVQPLSANSYQLTGYGQGFQGPSLRFSLRW